MLIPYSPAVFCLKLPRVNGLRRVRREAFGSYAVSAHGYQRAGSALLEPVSAGLQEKSRLAAAEQIGEGIHSRAAAVWIRSKVNEEDGSS